jgi:hypothetical protein
MTWEKARVFRSPNRRHDRQFFFNYVTAAVAKIVLTTRKLRWSSPLLFNDPFDVTQELRLNIDEARLSAVLTDKVAFAAYMVGSMGVLLGVALMIRGAYAALQEAKRA